MDGSRHGLGYDKFHDLTLTPMTLNHSLDGRSRASGATVRSEPMSGTKLLKLPERRARQTLAAAQRAQRQLSRYT
jgi:hypothetical protein